VDPEVLDPWWWPSYKSRYFSATEVSVTNPNLDGCLLVQVCTLVKLDVQRFYWFPFLKSNPTVLFPTPGSTFQPRDLKPANAPYTSVEASVSSRPTTTVGDCTVHVQLNHST